MQIACGVLRIAWIEDSYSFIKAFADVVLLGRRMAGSSETPIAFSDAHIASSRPHAVAPIGLSSDLDEASPASARIRNAPTFNPLSCAGSHHFWTSMPEVCSIARLTAVRTHDWG
jgi:hypothetical protein